MILLVKEISVRRISPRAHKTKRIIVYACDQCGRIFERKFQRKCLNDRQFHLCSYECMGKSRSAGGIACEYQLRSRDMKVWHEHVKNTLQRRYNVDNPGCIEWVKRKKIETFRQRYGVDHPQQIPDVKRRTLETHAKNAHSWMSAPEKEVRLILEELFGVSDVKVQQLLEHKWSIDFYITSINTYVQFDSVYWHGLDRPIELIKASSGKRDRAIYLKWIKDRELDDYVVKQGIRLVRITDVEFDADPRACLLRIVGNSNGSTLHRSS